MLNDNKTTLIALLSAAVLSACGGGGSNTDSPDSERIDSFEDKVAIARIKYVGTWTSGCSFETTNFYIKSSITLRTQGMADLVGDYSEIYYSDVNCTLLLAANNGDSWTTTYTLLGSTKTLTDGRVADRVRATVPEEGQENVRVQAILYTADNKLWEKNNEPDTEDANENVDTEGFPNSLDLANYMTKVIN